MSRPRRHDPDRRERILDAALVVIAEHGLVNTTHRRIAAVADVPLGSLTYHFTGLDDLCQQAFERHAARMSVAYAAHFEGVEGREALVDALTELICGDAGADDADWAVAYELYLAALRRPALRSVTQGWMEASRATLGHHLDPATARGVDALIEGMVMHNTLSTAPLGRADVRRAVARQVGPPD